MLVRWPSKSQTMSLVIIIKKKILLCQEYPEGAEYTCIKKTLEKQKELLQVGIITNSW